MNSQSRAKRSIVVKGVLLVAALVLSSCGSDGSAVAADPNKPTVAVTTNILGDVVENLAGDQFNVVTIMPVGADPHEFQASAQQVAQISEANAIVANGAGFEEGLLDIIEAQEAEGVPVFEAISAVDAIEYAEGESHDEHDDEHDDDEHDDEHDDDEHDDDEHDDDEHDDDEHDDDEHDDDEHDDHGHGGGPDPHFFTDPVRMAQAVVGITAFLADVEGVDSAALESSSSDYVAELASLDMELDTIFEAIPADNKILVTNHEVFGYLAQQYDFEVVGAVIPSGSTGSGVSAEALAELAEVIEHEGVPAIFADTSASDALVQTLADEVGNIAVVELFSESLGDADSDGGTYVDMVRTNAERIADALSG